MKQMTLWKSLTLCSVVKTRSKQSRVVDIMGGVG